MKIPQAAGTQPLGAHTVEQGDGVSWASKFLTAPRFYHLLIVGLLMTVQVAAAVMSSTASTDTNRDIFFAWQIANGREFPLIGPVINGIFHLGPLWYYVLSPAAWLIPNAAGIVGWMALIGSLQFPLAYRLGSCLGSARLGLFFALALAMPGIMAVSLVSLTHTIAVIPCLLLLVFAALAYRAHPDGRHGLCLGVCSALCLNAHPTTLVFVAAAAIWSAAKTTKRKYWVGHGLLVALPIVLSFAPMLYAQWLGGFADATTTVRYAGSGITLPSPRNVMTLILTTVYYAPKYFTRFWLDVPPNVASCLLAGYFALIFAACLGLVHRFFHRTGDRQLILALLGLVVLQSIFVCAIRADMPPWMIYAQWPLIAALAALGLESIAETGATLRCIVGAGLLTTTLWSVAIWAHMATIGIEFVEMKPSKGKLPFLGDVREYNAEYYVFRMPRIPFRQDFALGRLLCEPVTLYGHYAYLADISYGVGALASCGNRDKVQLGGMPDPSRRSLVGLHDEAWRLIGIQATRHIGVLGIVEPTSVWASPVPLYPETPLLTAYPHKITAVTKHFVIEGNAPRKQIVLISHRLPRYEPFKVIEAKANGVAVAPVYEDVMTTAYRLPPGFSAEDVHWQIEVDGTADYIDALTIEAPDVL